MTDDLISRADAINKIENAYLIWGDDYGISDALCDLDDMPSAQPESEEFEWCTDCKEYLRGENICQYIKSM